MNGMCVDDLFFHINETDDANALCLKWHYSKRLPANVQAVGTFHEPGGLFGTKGDCVAACFISSPPTRWDEPVVELTRLVRGNRQVPLTRLVSMTLEVCKRKGFDLVVSYADWTQSHHGGIYQACSWNFHGLRKPACDGLYVNGVYTPGRTSNALYGTRSSSILKTLNPSWTIEEHFDEGKYLYWKPLNKAGKRKAERLGLQTNPYPKPDNVAAMEPE